MSQNKPLEERLDKFEADLSSIRQALLGQSGEWKGGLLERVARLEYMEALLKFVAGVAAVSLITGVINLIF